MNRNGALDVSEVDPTQTSFVCSPDTSGPLVAQSYIKASNSDAGDQFGQNLALSGDTLVVAARGESSCISGVNPLFAQSDNACSFAGAVYIYDRDPSTQEWSQSAYVKASDAGNLTGFANSVDVEQNTLVVGAELRSGGGAAYVFERDPSTQQWSQAAILTASNPGNNDFFGHVVSVGGDRIAVGAYREHSCADGVNPPGGQGDDSCTDAGAVYLFERDTASGSWQQTDYIKSSNSDGGDYFGYDVEISGSTLVVGAPLERGCSAGVNLAPTPADNGCNSGASYIFEFDASSGVWEERAYLKSDRPRGTHDKGFGESVAVSGSVVVVAHPDDMTCLDGSFCPTSGAVYVYEQSDVTGAWDRVARLNHEGESSAESFGAAISLSGATLVVSAPGENGCEDGVDQVPAQQACSDAGIAYVFKRDTSSQTWLRAHSLKASNSEAADLFGGDPFNYSFQSVAVDGATIAAGAYGEDSCADGVDAAGGQGNNACSAAGAVYTFE